MVRIRFTQGRLRSFCQRVRSSHHESQIDMSRTHQAAGFTLLEALVVMVITSLVSVVLVQGFGLILSARASVETKLVDVDHAILQNNILLEPLRGIVPDYPNQPNVFAGSATTLQALTTRPLQGRTGTPVGFK